MGKELGRTTLKLEYYTWQFQINWQYFHNIPTPIKIMASKMEA